MRGCYCGLVVACLLIRAAGARGEEVRKADQPQLVEVRKIWDQDPHSAFTDLIRFRDQWICVFRVGTGHASPDGAIQVLGSADGKSWKPLARLRSPQADLRDPKLSVTPQGKLMIVAAAVQQAGKPVKHQSMVWMSEDGQTWDEGTPVGDPNVWLWRVCWHKESAYGIGYSTMGERFVQLYSSKDGRQFTPVGERLLTEGYPNESCLSFAPDDTCYCLLRRDGKPSSAQVGMARPPYTRWEWKDLDVRLGGPQMLRLPEGQLLATVRLYSPRTRTALCEVDPAAGKVREILGLPSGGDTSYAGMVWHEGLLWISYYSSHEHKPSIYIACVRLP